MSLPFDATLKSIVASHPGDFVDVFNLPRNEPVAPINVDLSTLSAATDVALAYGKPIQTIVDLNFQTGPDTALPRRLHLYNAALHSRYNVPVRSILVLLRQKADAPNLTGTLTYGEAGCKIEFRYDVIRLWQLPVEDFLHANLAALPLATLCRMPAGQPLTEALRDVVQAIHRRLGQETTHADAMKLMTAAYILTKLRVKKTDLDSLYRGVGPMNELTAYDEDVEKGERHGRAQTLLRQGRRRFGEPDAAAEAELRSIRDLERLDRLADAILTANSWAELLATA
ncbi:MAG: DUF4351 domain-containing protein [Bacteroidales bacterium]|nr:DUF4351 domain-containing protein [Bacteroidales bacterium]